MYQISYLRNNHQVAAAQKLKVSTAVIEAVSAVEARESGFIPGTDRPVILFEGHLFHRLTKGRFSTSHPDISYPKWTKSHYKGGIREYDRLIRAMRLDETAALSSASVGAFQILGSNHQACGYQSVHEYWNAMASGEELHLAAFVAFVLANPKIHDALRSEDFTEFARRYNGPGFAANQYDTRMAAALARSKAEGEDPERGDMMAVQAALNVNTGSGLSVDGWMGSRTRAALLAYQEANGLPQTGSADLATCERLGVELISGREAS